ncbi:hypothetical protein LAZ67_23000797 [Cordylochernes scorpioides]|uniref:Integrase catalytic domain-containing protein n=1 Tax=Cordylochernes scorpioides TaxID=51811 RepID=A0ABY6LQ70_9ARAC|nr:hypothetical protein LAZ67_23000797 [Cordylochernes scorpioides]
MADQPVSSAELKKLRTPVRAWFTKAFNELETEIKKNEVKKADVEKILRRLQTHHEKLSILNMRMEEALLRESASEDIFTAEYESVCEYEDNFSNIMTDYEALAEKDDVSTISGTAAMNYRLPKLEFKKFGGEPREWITFWSQFSMIDRDPQMPPETKFQYLFQATAENSEVREAVESFPPSADNYPKVIEYIKSRFGEDEMLVEIYVRDLLQNVLQNVRAEGKMSVVKLYDRLETQLRALETLGVARDKFAAMLYPLVESALPEDTLRVWERSQYTRSYISKRMVDALGLKRVHQVTLTHNLFGGGEIHQKKHNVYKVNVSSLNNEYMDDLKFLDQEVICGHISQVQDHTILNELKARGINLTDICQGEEISIHMLIGSDLLSSILTGRMQILQSGVVATETKLGWTVMGPAIGKDMEDSCLIVTSFHVNSFDVQDLWKLDVLGIMDAAETKSRKDLIETSNTHFKETVKRDESGRYIVSLPWIAGHPPVPVNRRTTENRFLTTTRNVQGKMLYEKYDTIFEEWEKEKFIEEVEDKWEECSYLPHRPGNTIQQISHPVVNPIEIHKIRMVGGTKMASGKERRLASIKKLIVKSVHEKMYHCGAQTLRSVLREKFWIPKARQLVRHVIHKCPRCRRFEAKRVDVPEASLPQHRVRDVVVFEVTGIDLGGPLYLEDGQKRFVARRGCPAVIYSDSGTNLVGLRNELYRVNFGVKWKLNPPAAPWWGGWIERIVGLTKKLLRRLLGKRVVNYEEMVTILENCERVINARPLTYIAEDNDDLVPLTPEMFLREPRAEGEIDLNEFRCNFGKNYEKRKRLLKEFRKRFRSEYLGLLVHHDNRKKQRQLKVGDIVLVEVENRKQINWPMGKITKVFPGTDNVRRLVEVKTKSGFMKRTVQRLFPLEVPSEDVEQGDGELKPAEDEIVREKTSSVESASVQEKTTPVKVGKVYTLRSQDRILRRNQAFLRPFHGEPEAQISSMDYHKEMENNGPPPFASEPASPPPVPTLLDKTDKGPHPSTEPMEPSQTLPFTDRNPLRTKSGRLIKPVSRLNL